MDIEAIRARHAGIHQCRRGGKFLLCGSADSNRPCDAALLLEALSEQNIERALAPYVQTAVKFPYCLIPGTVQRAAAALHTALLSHVGGSESQAVVGPSHRPPAPEPPTPRRRRPHCPVRGCPNHFPCAAHPLPAPAPKETP